ncbi:MAG TPA: NUDIX domain-containing protein [Caproiciproducens sp.]|nr:NUDIX domain-containing protein [Caproiciproducens sp.]
MEVRFYSSVKNSLLKFAVIVSMYQNQWVYCKHKQRDTYEVPGGHREAGEDILSAAKRELFEETGATEYDIRPVCAYSVDDHDGETFGMLYFADIKSFGELPAFEMEKVALFPGIPDKLTYPMIQPKLVEKAISAVFPEKSKSRRTTP